MTSLAKLSYQLEQDEKKRKDGSNAIHQRPLVFYVVKAWRGGEWADVRQISGNGMYDDLTPMEYAMQVAEQWTSAYSERTVVKQYIASFVYDSKYGYTSKDDRGA